MNWPVCPYDVIVPDDKGDLNNEPGEKPGAKDSPDSEAAVEQLLRSLEQELREAGKLPAEPGDAADDTAPGGADDGAADDGGAASGAVDDLDPDDTDTDDARDSSRVIFGLPSDLDPKEMFGELSQMFARLAEGSDQLGALFSSYEPALQLAIKVATDDQPEPSVEPTSRIRLEELFRVAQMHINSAQGASMDVSDHKLDVITRKEWVTNLMKDFWPIFDPQSEEELTLSDPMGLVQNLMLKLASTARLMQVGGMLGELSRSAFGYYVLPIPPSAQKSSRPVGILSTNVEAFADQWDLDFDQAGLWVCINEILSHAILSRPAVRDTLWQLYENYVAEIDDSAALEWEEKLKDFEHSFMGDPAEVLQSLFGDSGEVAIQFSDSDLQVELAGQISAIVSAVVGHVQFLAQKIAATLLGPESNLAEAFRRHQQDLVEGSTFGRQILGIAVDMGQGLEFISELDSLQGEKAMAKLWSEEAALPTPAELEAPRLWLARMDLL